MLFEYIWRKLFIKRIQVIALDTMIERAFERNARVFAELEKKIKNSNDLNNK